MLNCCACNDIDDTEYAINRKRSRIIRDLFLLMAAQ